MTTPKLPYIERLEDRRLLAAPSLDPIGPVDTLPVGKTIQIPLTATDAEGNRVIYSATSNSGSVVPFVRPRDGTFIRMNVRNFGAMEFQLFNANAPETVRRIVGLVNSDFYDGLTFHRLVDGFVIQGGDPIGNGTGDSPDDGLGDNDQDGRVPDSPEFIFDDEFNPSNIFSQSGTLALANSGKDTNASQFFVTVGSQRALDFNHTILGQLVRGFNVLNAINQSPTDANGRPIDPVTIDSVEVVENQTDAVLQLRSVVNSPANVTVTVTDTNGESSSRTFSVTPQVDSVNEPPILGRIDNQTVSRNGTLNIALTSTDFENDSVLYAVDVIDPSVPRSTLPSSARPVTSLGTATVSNNVLTFTPPRGYTGPVDLVVGVRQDPETARGSTGNPFDTQRIRVAVGDQPVAVSAVNVDAARNVPFEGALVATITDQDLGSNETAFAADVDWGDGTVSRGRDEDVRIVPTGTPGVYNVTASHSYEGFVANLPLTVTVNGNKGVQATAVARAEVRALGDLDLRQRILFVNATDGPDSIGAVGDVENNLLRININGTIEEFQLNLVERLEIQAYGSDDDVRLGRDVPNTYAFGDDGNDVMVGGPGRDTMSGGSGKNFLYGMGGDDRLQGSNGRDYLDGGEGVDRLYGDLDRDRDTGRGGNDTIFGGAGRDNIFAGAGNDYIDGGTSNDPIRADFGDDTIFGGRGRDILDGGPGTNLTLRSDLDDPDETAMDSSGQNDSDLLINITIVDELDRIQPFFL